jgi:hypothetical protein
MVETAMRLQADVKNALAGMAEWRVAEVMGQRQRFRKIFIQTELPGQRARDLSYLKRVGQPGAVVITFVEYEYLGFVLETAKGSGMNHPVAIASEWTAGLAWRLAKKPPATANGIARKDRPRSSHSDRHGVLVLPKGLIPASCVLNYA